MGIGMKPKKKDKAKYRKIYDWIRVNRCAPENFEAILINIDPEWDGNNGIIFDDDIDEAYLQSFSPAMGQTFGWPDPITGEKYKRKHGVIWWLLIGWWWSILKALFRLLPGLKQSFLDGYNSTHR